MKWTTPDFQEINLSGEVTAYVNTDDEVQTSEQYISSTEIVDAVTDKRQEILV